MVEILSPGTRNRDRFLKRDLYERAGVREYWLVDLDRDVVSVYRRRGDNRFDSPEGHSSASRHVLSTPLLPGLAIAVDRLLGSGLTPTV